MSEDATDPTNTTDPIEEAEGSDGSTFLLKKAAYHKQTGRPDVFVGNKGDRIPTQVAINLGLVKGTATAKKALTIDDIENKAMKPAKKGSKKPNPSEE